MEQNAFIESYKSSVKRLYTLTTGQAFPAKAEPLLSKMIEEALIKTADKNRVVIHNNFHHTVEECDLVDVIGDVYGNKNILSAYGTLWARHSDNLSPLISFINYVQDRRKREKKIELEHLNDEDQTITELHHLLQILCKLVINAEYGASAQGSYFMANSFVGPSTTYNGYTIITSGVMFLEALMENNIQFESTNDAIRFIEECAIHASKYEDPIAEWLDDPNAITPEILIDYLTKTKCAEGCYIDRQPIVQMVNTCTQEFINRIYYTNNLKAFLFQDKVADLLGQCYDQNFTDPNVPTEQIKVPMGKINDLVRKYVAHPFVKFNRSEIVKRLKRRSVLLVDSDSLFAYLGKFITETFEELFEVDPEVRNTKEHKIAVAHIGNNIIANMIQDILDAVTSGLSVSEDYQKHINMKSEFLFRRLVMTPNKKNYASIVMVREGKVFDTPKPDIKGLDLKKVSTNAKTRKFFTQVLYDEYLFTDTINPKNILRKFVEFENEIYSSLTQKLNTDFLKPGKFTNFTAYKSPTANSVCKAVILWNAMYPNDQIQPYSKVYMLPISQIRGTDDLESIREKFATEYNNASKVFTNNADYFEKSGAKFIAIPKRIDKIPEALVGLIDFNKIVEDNTRADYPLMGSLGFQIQSIGSGKTFSSFIEV
jgi:hypothetical protein